MKLAAIAATYNEFDFLSQFVDYYEKQVDTILDGGMSLLELSTVLDLTDEQPVVIREGVGDVSMYVMN